MPRKPVAYTGLKWPLPNRTFMPQMVRALPKAVSASAWNAGLMTGRRRAVERQRAVFDEHRRFAEQVVAEAKIRFRLEELIGMTVADARAVVETAGGEFATDNGPIRAKWDPNRVIASVDGDRVIRVNVG